MHPNNHFGDQTPEPHKSFIPWRLVQCGCLESNVQCSCAWHALQWCGLVGAKCENTSDILLYIDII